MNAHWPRSLGEPDSPDEPSGDAPRVIGAGESWRSWIMSGNRVKTADPRRVRGAHRGLKKMLIEGVVNGGRYPESWRHFSGAMVRLAINDALNALPSEQTRVVWLAYFAGFSNKEIARHLGLSVAAVQRRLRQALASIADQIERGRSVALGWVLAIVGARHALGGHRVAAPAVHAVRAVAAITAGVAAAAVLAVPPDAPATAHHQSPGPVAASGHKMKAGPGSAGAVQLHLPSGQAAVPPTVPSRPPVTVSVPGIPGLGLPPVPPLPPLPKVSPLPPPPIRSVLTASFK